MEVLKKTNILLSKCFLWQKQGLQRSGGEQICPLLMGSGPFWTCAQEPAGHLWTLGVQHSSWVTSPASVSSLRPWVAAAELLWNSFCTEPVLITPERTLRTPSSHSTHTSRPPTSAPPPPALSPQAPSQPVQDANLTSPEFIQHPITSTRLKKKVALSPVA